MEANFSCIYFKAWYERKEELRENNRLFIVINSILAIPTGILNTLLLIAIWRTSSLHSPSNVFLCNLAIADLAVAIFSEPGQVIWALLTINGAKFSVTCNTAYTVSIISSVFSSASFLTIAAATVDRHLALKLHLRYVSIVTTSRVIVVCILVWVISVAIALLMLISQSLYNYFMIVGIFTTTGAVLFCYYKIFLIIRHHHNQIHSQMSNNGAASLTNMLSYKKSVVNLVYVLILYYLFLSPFVVVNTLIEFKTASTSLLEALSITILFVFANSAVNPIIYCWRLRELRHAINETISFILGKIKCHGG